MRALVLLGLVALGCSPVSVEGARFGEEAFPGVAAVAAELNDDVVVVIHTDPASCDDVPPATPLRRAMTLQSPLVVGEHALEDASAALVTDVCGVNSRIVTPSDGVLEILRVDEEEIEAEWRYTVDGVPANGRFVSPLCDELPVPVRNCGDEP